MQRSDDPSYLQAPLASWSDAQVQSYLRARIQQRMEPAVDAEQAPQESVEALFRDQYDFAGKRHHLPAPLDWLSNPDPDIEWHILLHKFYYAPALGKAYRDTADARYRDKWMELTRSWMASVPAGFIAAEVTGRRVQNWVHAYAWFVGDLPAAFHRAFLRSLHAQVAWLRANLHDARNHRTLELQALFLAAVALPELAGHDELMHWSLAEIVVNMHRDLRPDGVHCEQSTDYHHLVLKNYLNVRLLAQRNSLSVPIEMDDLLLRALEFSMHAHRPDGKIPSLSDGDVRDFRELLRQGAALYGRDDMLYVATAGEAGVAPARRSHWFAHGGYAVLRSAWEERPYDDARYAIFDCGPLGEGNHGHLDLLSVELYGHGRPLVVDPGRYTYHEDTDDNWRVRFRGTAYHNTVVVDGRNQTRYAPGRNKFKIQGPSPLHELLAFDCTQDMDHVCGSARSFEYDAEHVRHLYFIRGQYWVIVDDLRAPHEHLYEQTFHLAAHAWQRTAVSQRHETARVLSPHLVIAHRADASTHVALDDGYVSECYGDKQPAPVVRIGRQARNTRFVTALVPYRLEAPTVQVSAGDTIEILLTLGGRTQRDVIALHPLTPVTASALEIRVHA